MKSFLLTLFVFASIQGFSQTFKITKIETNQERRYQDLNKSALNKDLKVVFNDNTVTITPKEKNNPIALKKVSDNNYSYSFTGSRPETYSVVFYKTFGVISSLKFSYSTISGGESLKNTFTAKRF
ncbi:hypothetical protein [Pedobacter gandavensis]|uniref:DUF4251 domain-containing protein n=1 Tax=Pedobacter gandavensis TaxID=2679963 RepID=A0ABR6F2P2_9SPHI|nr:hypothetical protein [Pedobacter gandavensis]MBB2151706.1 hypothetical protein [Pedobacter gandavensis]